jgi:hypothetical protein
MQIHRRSIVSKLAFTIFWGIAWVAVVGAVAISADPTDSVLWSFDESDPAFESVGKVETVPTGPTSTDFRGLPDRNQAIEFLQAGAHLRVADDSSGKFDFGLNDAITLEAWVRLKSIKNGANVYIVSKGRTYELGQKENQNYGLRLVGSNSSARLSFLFATLDDNDKTQYHRWNSDKGFGVDGGWHHVAVSYVFGQPDSIRGYVDGKASEGKWDMAGATTRAPVVDDDSVWIGSSRGGDPANSLLGGLDQVCIHRHVVDADELATRRIVEVRPPTWPSTAQLDRVTVTLHEAAGSHTAFPSQLPEESFRFSTPKLALHRLPLKYLSGGIREAWAGPVLMRAFAKAELPEGEIEFLVRSPGLARLWVDGEVVLGTPAHRMNLNAHQPFVVYERDLPWLRVPRSGVHEQRKKLTLPAGIHEIVLESLVGSKTTRCETNETMVAFRQHDAMFAVLAPAELSSPPLYLVDEDFWDYREQLETQLQLLDRQLLTESSKQEDAFWNKRHELANSSVEQWPALEIPAVPSGSFTENEGNLIDRYLSSGISPESIAALPKGLSDSEFLRRVSLDTVGVPPSLDELAVFRKSVESLGASESRTMAILQLLNDDRWADHWTSYWQDVLAENPNILKPSLNNSGPFRWWIHDALVLNKGADRFVTELLRMEGDSQSGGTSGFSIASENDVPMAEKAHIVASSFLAINMKCARCHDAPYHPWKQRDLFRIGAMLNQKEITVPESSSVPLAFFDRRGEDSPIKVTLKPGEIVSPEWPSELLPVEEFGPLEIDPELLATPASSRDRIAAMITRADNRRFAKTMVNRIWTRLMGWGLVDDTDDWFEAESRFPGLLDHLSREFVTSGFDLKHIHRLIVESRAYGRNAIEPNAVSRELRYLAPWQRRMSAEQLVDSLHHVTGVSLETEEITFDPEGSQQSKNFLNLGVANRAWMLTSLSNERDRPSLNLPKAAAVVECLEAFGWRSSRQSPITHREMEPNFVQPGVVANGNLTGWTSRLTEESQITQIALQSESAEGFVEQLFAAILSRAPTESELQTFCQQLEPGFAERLQTPPATEKQPPPNRGFATWTNHFSVEANALVRELERETAAGPEPTQRLRADWRERAEDAVWALLNTPEFQIVP